MHFWTSAAKLLSSIVLRSETLLHNIYLLSAVALTSLLSCFFNQKTSDFWPLLLLSSYFTSSAGIQRIFCPPASTLHPSYSISNCNSTALTLPSPKMAGPNSAKRPQGNRIRPKSVAVAIPLKYEKKQSQKAVAPEKNQNNVTTTKLEDTTSPATTSGPFYTPGAASKRTNNGGFSPPGENRILKSEHYEISLPSQQESGQQEDSAGVGSSWAGNAQSTCIIEPDQGKDLYAL